MDYTEIPPALSNSKAPVFGQSAGWGAQTESRLEVMAGIRWAKVGRRRSASVCDFGSTRPGEPHSTALPGAGALGRHGSAPPQKARSVILNRLSSRDYIAGTRRARRQAAGACRLVFS